MFRSARANEIAFWAQMVFGLWLLGSAAYGGWSEWPKWGGAAPKSPHYGIWTLDRLSIDGHERSPLLNDYGRRRRVIFDYPEYMGYERMDNSTAGYGAQIDVKNQNIALTMDSDKKWKGKLHYQRVAESKPSRSPSMEGMILDGELGSHPVHFELQLMDRNKLMLVSRGFHWVQEYPFFR